jgi:hypothetical protein
MLSIGRVDIRAEDEGRHKRVIEKKKRNESNDTQKKNKIFSLSIYL